MSTLRVNTLQTQAGVEVYTAKAWVNFNGTGTVAIRGAGNVSSITDNGTGSYTVNFTTALADANYSAVATSGTDGVSGDVGHNAANIRDTSTSSVWVINWNDADALVDVARICVSVFR